MFPTRTSGSSTSRQREYFRAGRNSQDSPETAQRRREAAVAQWWHRVQCRGNEEANISQTPPIQSSTQSPFHHPSSQPPQSLNPGRRSPSPLYFSCDSCGINRGLSSAVIAQEPLVCIYCARNDFKGELIWCKRGSHEQPKRNFYNSRHQRLATCRQCRSSITASVADSEPTPSQAADPGPASSQAADPEYAADPERAPSEVELPDGAAIPEDHWKLIEDFREALKQERMDTCCRCHERWFNMRLKDGVCDRCNGTRDKGNRALTL